MDPTDVFGVQVHIGEAVTGDMPQDGDGGGGTAGDRAALSIIGNAASKACATARRNLAVAAEVESNLTLAPTFRPNHNPRLSIFRFD